jgi:outer membrane protein assembly factor BamE (lipoprotein component of BamABCDE complex)
VIQRLRALSRRALLASALVAGSAALVGCVSPVPRDFVSTDSIQQVRSGMSRHEVKRLLGAPLVSDKKQNDRWDYMVATTTTRPMAFTPYGVYFEDGRVAKVEPLNK